MRRWRLKAAAGAAGVALLAAACGSGSGGTAASPVTLTIWENYGTEQNATALQNLAKAFEKLHRTIKVSIVSQDASNYFAQLQAAAVSRSGPDLAVMWTGLFTLQYKDFLVNLKGKIPAADLARVDPNALKWTSDGFNPANGPYVIPLENQFYIGFYNKTAFKKAGVSSVPTDWSQLFAACKKLKSAGYTPMVYGNGGQPLGAEFYPWYDMSYMMIGKYSVAQWQDIYSGKIPWTSPTVAAQLSEWAKLKSSGCTNPDVLTNTQNLGQFESGRAAMMVDGTWDTQKFTKALGSQVAAFVPPYSDTPIKGVVDFAGDGLSETNYAQHPQQAQQFLAFMTTDQAARIINAAGLIPAINGVATSNPVNQEMLSFVSQQHMTVYPMLDNVTQPNVVNAGSKFLPSVLNGTIPVHQALSNLQTTWSQLPASQRGSSYQ
ncbi:MAG: ABC transporter substrate-binding protein [Streptosporangiaceae bacterium]